MYLNVQRVKLSIYRLNNRLMFVTSYRWYFGFRRSKMKLVSNYTKTDGSSFFTKSVIEWFHICHSCYHKLSDAVITLNFTRNQHDIDFTWLPLHQFKTLIPRKTSIFVQVHDCNVCKKHASNLVTYLWNTQINCTSLIRILIWMLLLIFYPLINEQTGQACMIHWKFLWSH